MITLYYIYEQIPNGVKKVLDCAGASAALATLFGFMQGAVAFLATAVSLAYASVRLYETKTFQRLLRKYRKWSRR